MDKTDFIKEWWENEDADREFFRQVSMNMDDNCATMALHYLSKFLYRYYGKKVIILLDEYDTPMQEAYVGGYWEEMVSFIRSMFNAAFKTNPWLGRAIMTGITRVSTPKASLGKESIFSDLNNLKVVTTTSEKYEDCFGFTEKEVFDALDEFGLSGEKENVKKWYDGFTFGKIADIYNPWSIINYLDTKKVGAYWANTSSNSLVGKLVREGSGNIKQEFEGLMRGESIYAKIDEQIVYNQLEQDEQAIWSLLLASGYLKVESMEASEEDFGWGDPTYELRLTNREVKLMFRNMVHRWFGSASSMYNDFIKALLLDDLKAMNAYMNEVALTTFSYFDTGKNPARSEPERFYHGFGRYDVMLEPRSKKSVSQVGDSILYDAVIMEFKVQDTEEKELSDTVKEALAQIERKGYEAELIKKGIPKEKIRKYGFAFCGKKVLIGR